MDTSKTKKSLSLVLAIIMLFTMIPTTIFTLASGEDYPMMKAYVSLPPSSLPDHHAYRSSIVTVTFLDEIDTTGAVASWDISASAETGTVMSWIKRNDAESDAANADRYDLYIAGDGGVATNVNSTNVFYNFTVLKEVNGLENLDTSNSTTLDCFFENCSSLVSVDLSSFNTSNVTNLSYLFSGCKSLNSVNFSNWDTSKVTNMGFMFANCETISVLDISNFDTRKVTNMKRMFYRCMNLNPIYAGPDWSVEQAKDTGEMFNCCYAIVGGKDIYDKDFQYVSPGKEYATFEEDGGFLTYKEPAVTAEYTVTYSFIGETIPEGVIPPESAIYEEGTTVTVENAPTADGYVFSGWSTDDATVTDGSFTINNDVHFVGSWSKLYKVTYEYTDGYTVPDGAPELPQTKYYTAGEVVDLSGVPYVDRYLFVGWTTKDTDVSGDMFIMPDNDVVLYGYFKIPVESIEIMMDEKITINEEEEIRLNIYVKPEDATIKDIIFESGDDSIVTVDKYGNIKAVGEGTTTVTVYSKDDETKKDTIEVTVKIPVTDITADKDKITLNKNGTDKITVTVTPHNATNKDVTFKSSDENIVKIDENGNITAVGEGETTIIITSNDNPTVKEIIPVTVKNPVTEITVRDKLTLNIDDIENLDAKVNEDATNKELIYESDNPGVVKVDINGDVIAVGEGTATIIITSKDNPSITETVTVTVKIPVDDVIVDKNNITLDVGETDKITTTVTPDNATEKGVTYKSSDETVVKVDEDGNIEAVGEGTATITVTSKDDPTKTETIKVTVEVPVDDVIVDKNNITLDVGETDKITTTVTPDNATEKGVTYKSSDETVVKVDEDGNIEAVGEGTATITVTSKDNNEIKETVTVTVKIPEPVKVPVEDVIVDKSDFYLEVGETDKINATVSPDDATEKGIIYKSDDETVVKVDEDGNIIAVGEGTTTIRVISKDDITKSETVLVKVKPKKVPVEDVVVDKTEITLEVGKTDKITGSVTPENATEKGVTYKSSDETIVKVDDKGNIEAIGEGTATITVTSKDDPTKTETVTVTVNKPTVPDEPEKPEYTIEVPDGISIFKGEKKPLGVVITPDDGSIVPIYKSSDESVVKIDAQGNITGVGIGIAIITADFGGGDIRLIPVTVLAIPVKHHVCFGKTDGIGWYEVSVNGGDFFPQGPNSTLEVYEGSVLVVRVQDLWIDDEFDFYVNGKKVPLDPANTITVVVDGYMLIGALSMDVPVPDVEESVSLFRRLLNAIAEFFRMIANWFKGK